MRFAYCGYDFCVAALDEIISRGHTLLELFTYPTDNEYDFNDGVFAQARRANARITLSPMNQDDLERLRTSKVDLVISAGYPYKIPDWQDYVTYALNVHPSLLPEGRGRWPLPWMILKSLAYGGISIHEVSSSWDEGDLLAQVTFPLSEIETLESLSAKCQIQIKELLPNVLDDIEDRWRRRLPQVGGSYWAMPQASDRTINWQMGVEQIDRVVRAFSKSEAFVWIDGIRHFVRTVNVWKADHGLDPGTLVVKSRSEAVYAAADGFVCLSNYVRSDSDEI